MKQIFTLLCSCALFFAQAQKETRIALVGGTTGAGLTLERTVGRKFTLGLSTQLMIVNATIGTSFFDYYIRTNASTNTFHGESFMSWYPWKDRKNGKSNTWLFLKTGVAFDNAPEYHTHSVLTHNAPNAEVAFQSQELGTIEASARTRSLQPFVNLGIRILQTKRFFIGTEWGILYQGAPHVHFSATGMIDDSYVDLQLVDKIVSPYKWYPVLRLETGVRF